MSDTNVVKVASRRREAARKKPACDLLCAVQTVAATLETARVCSLRPTASDALASLVGVWHAEYCVVGGDAREQALRALRALRDRGAEPPP